MLSRRHGRLLGGLPGPIGRRRFSSCRLGPSSRSCGLSRRRLRFSSSSDRLRNGGHRLGGNGHRLVGGRGRGLSVGALVFGSVGLVHYG